MCMLHKGRDGDRLGPVDLHDGHGECGEEGRCCSGTRALMLAMLLLKFDARQSDPKNVTVCFGFPFHPLKLLRIKH